ncbi:MAG: Cna B-type domain-containing protein [Oscillospiraceae bacterium]
MHFLDPTTITMLSHQLYERNSQAYGGTPTFANTTAEDDSSVSVRKVWQGDHSNIRPKYVMVQLYKNGIAYGDRVTLEEKNNWYYTWTGLDPSALWTADEISHIAGYTKSITRNGTSWTITNTSSRPKPDRPDDSNDAGAPEVPSRPYPLHSEKMNPNTGADPFHFSL